MLGNIKLKIFNQKFVDLKKIEKESISHVDQKNFINSNRLWNPQAYSSCERERINHSRSRVAILVLGRNSDISGQLRFPDFVISILATQSAKRFRPMIYNLERWIDEKKNEKEEKNFLEF